jgi:hypothetical protein
VVRSSRFEKPFAIKHWDQQIRLGASSAHDLQISQVGQRHETAADVSRGNAQPFRQVIPARVNAALVAKAGELGEFASEIREEAATDVRIALCSLIRAERVEPGKFRTLSLSCGDHRRSHFARRTSASEFHYARVVQASGPSAVWEAQRPSAKCARRRRTWSLTMLS